MYRIDEFRKLGIYVRVKVAMDFHQEVWPETLSFPEIESGREGLDPLQHE